jgi:hypothetical protein
MIKLTNQQINERLNSKGIRIIGNYVDSVTPSLFICENNHEFVANAGNIMRPNRGCPECIKLTQDIVNQRIKSHGLEMIDEYVSATTKAKFKCSNNHTWLAIPHSVMISDAGCPYCSEKFPWTKERLNEKIKTRNIELFGDYLGANRKTTFKCIYNHTWITKTANILNGSGCPKCSKSGFNPNKPAHGYIIQFDDFLKFGITNNLEQRLKSHRMNGEYTVIVTKKFTLGQVALDWENTIKKTHGGRYVTKDRCPDGYTETLSTLLLNDIQKLLLEFK